MVYGCWLLVVDYWFLITGFWLLVSDYWLLITGFWLLVSGCWFGLLYCLDAFGYRAIIPEGWHVSSLSCIVIVDDPGGVAHHCPCCKAVDVWPLRGHVLSLGLPGYKRLTPPGSCFVSMRFPGYSGCWFLVTDYWFIIVFAIPIIGNR